MIVHDINISGRCLFLEGGWAYLGIRVGKSGGLQKQ
eukprot:SAG31_NODE_47156_length_251_cov_1.013158_1_plen_35_part_10